MRLRWSGIWSTALFACAFGCTDSQDRCPNSCPAGQVCDPSLGRCIKARPLNCPDDLGRYLSLALDSAGGVVFSSYTADFGDLVVGRERVDGAIDCEYVDGTKLTPEPGQPIELPENPGLGDDVGLFSSLALDVLDRPSVAYFDRTHGRLKVAAKGAEGWKIATVPETSGEEHVVGQSCSLALDKQGLPHVAYLDQTNGSLKLARRFADGRWTVEVVHDPPGAGPAEPGVEAGRTVSLVLDSKDREWVAFHDLQTGSLDVAGRQPEGWTELVLDQGADVGHFVAAALDNDGNIAVAYHDRGEGVLKYTWNESGVLKRVVVDDGRLLRANGAVHQLPAGQHCALAFGQDGLPRILYLEGGSLELVLAVGKKGGGFQPKQILDRDGPVGFFNALALRQDRLRAGSFAYRRNDQGGSTGELRLYRLEPGPALLGGGR